MYLIIAIFIFCVLTWLIIKEYKEKGFIDNPIIGRKRLYIIAPITIIFLVSIEFLDFFKYAGWPVNLQWIYIGTIFSVTFFWLNVINDYTTRGKALLIRIISIPATVLLNILFAILVALLVGIVVPLLNEYSIIIIVLALILLFYILVKQFKFISATGSLKAFAFATVFSYIFFNVFILYIFGQYNLHLGIISDEKNLNITIFSHLLLAGGTFFFDFPKLDEIRINDLSNISLFVAILQFYIGLIVNILIVPFYISYISPLLQVNKDNQ